MANSFEQYRQAGAAARAMLVGAAAERWKVGRRIDHGQERRRVARERQEGDVRRARRRGREAAGAGERSSSRTPRTSSTSARTSPRTDSRAKSTGTATFTQDVKLPDMLTAVVAHPPRFGAKVKNIDAAGLKDVPGVRYVVEMPTGVAVLAANFWTARKGRDALKIEWDESSAVQAVVVRHRRRVQEARGDAGQGRTQGRRRGEGASPAPRRRSTPSTSSRISRTRRWSR